MPSETELRAAHCWETDDRIPRRPEMTEFRRGVRLQQARWRETHGHPIGSQPIAPKAKDTPRPVGSRLPLEYARETAANFMTPAAVEAARARASTAERHQTFDHQRFWADLLWSPSLAVNLFADFAGEARRWPDAPEPVREVRFAYSPGRLDPQFLNSLRTFDGALLFEDGIVGIDVNYNEWNKPETPKPQNLARYLEVAKRSRAFKPGATDALAGRSDLAVMWLEHLLLLSMLQHPSGAWKWGRYVVVHPAGNVDIADAVTRYAALLADTSTFAAMTLEDLLATDVLPESVRTLVTERYLPG
jgi:hypothetical protein